MLPSGNVHHVIVAAKHTHRAYEDEIECNNGDNVDLEIWSIGGGGGGSILPISKCMIYEPMVTPMVTIYQSTMLQLFTLGLGSQLGVPRRTAMPNC